MKKAHFYKAKSRLGLLNNPYRTANLNVGVEEAADYLLSSDFLANFPEAKIDSFDFPYPEKIDKSKYAKIMADSSGSFADLINKTISNDEMQVVIGGDHSITLGSVTSLLNRVDPNDIGYIQFDSHGDINTFASSPSGNFHGIYLRALIEDIDSIEINNLAVNKLDVRNIIYIGNLDLDPAEKVFVKKNKIRRINRDELIADRKKIEKELKQFVAKFRHIHVSFDVDIYDKSVVSATGIPCEKGFFTEDTHTLLEVIGRSAKNISVDLVEINPRKAENEKAIEIGQEILEILLN